MSIERIGNENIDTDFVDTATCPNCGREYVCDDGCVCGYEEE